MTSIFNVIRKDMSVYCLLTFLLSVVMVSEAYLMQFIIDAINFGQNRYIIISIMVMVFLIFQTILYYFQQFLTAAISKKSAYHYRKQIFNRIQQLSLESITGEKQDKLLSSLTVQIDQLESHYFYSIYWGGYLFCQLVVAVLVSFYFNPLMAILTLILSFPNLLVAVFFKHSLEKKQEELIATTHLSVSIIQDLIEGVVDWKTANKETNIFCVLDKKMSKLLKKQVNVEASQYVVISLNQLFSNILYFGSWIIGGLLIINGQFTLGGLIAFSQLLVRISYPIYTSSDLLAKYISGKKILETLSQEFPVVTEEESVQETVNIIAFDNFTLKNNEKMIPLSVRFVANKKYLLRGRSGSGKTTILKSILREYTDYGGNITINGRDISNINEQTIFNNIAYVPQQPHLFNAKLRDNLTLFSDDYTDNELFAVLKFVELSKWANTDSLEMMISNDSAKLSGGEAKRVFLARALLMDKTILLLDEFSSGIDYETLLKIESKLMDLDKSIIYITHVEMERMGDLFDEVIDLNQFFISKD